MEVEYPVIGTGCLATVQDNRSSDPGEVALHIEMGEKCVHSCQGCCVVFTHIFVGDLLIVISCWYSRSLPPDALGNIVEECIGVFALAGLAQSQDDLCTVEFAVDDRGTVLRQVHGHFKHLLVVTGVL